MGDALIRRVASARLQGTVRKRGGGCCDPAVFQVVAWREGRRPHRAGEGEDHAPFIFTDTYEIFGGDELKMCECPTETEVGWGTRSFPADESGLGYGVAQCLQDPNRRGQVSLF
jgi:hypothetical protein